MVVLKIFRLYLKFIFFDAGIFFKKNQIILNSTYNITKQYVVCF